MHDPLVVFEAGLDSAGANPSNHHGAVELEVPKGGHVCETGQHSQRAATGFKLSLERLHTKKGLINIRPFSFELTVFYSMSMT